MHIKTGHKIGKSDRVGDNFDEELTRRKKLIENFNTNHTQTHTHTHTHTYIYIYIYTLNSTQIRFDTMSILMEFNRFEFYCS